MPIPASPGEFDEIYRETPVSLSVITHCQRDGLGQASPEKRQDRCMMAVLGIVGGPLIIKGAESLAPSESTRTEFSQSLCR
jgi:hypothetical protein